MRQQPNFTLTLFLLSVLFIGKVAFSQETPKNDHLITLGFNWGIADQHLLNLSNNTWNKYTPSFVIPADSLNFSHGNYLGYGINSIVQGSIHFSYHTKLLDSKRIRSSVGIVFGGGSNFQSNQNWYRSETIRLDTLTSSQTGEQFFVDSTSEHSIGRTFVSDEFTIGLSQHFQTDPTRRFSLHLSFIAQYGFSINSKMTTYERTWSNSSSYDKDYYSDYHQEVLTMDRVPSAHSLSILIPLEISVQPWKNTKKMQGISIGLSVRPNVKLLKIDDQRTTLTGMLYGVSLRYSI